VRLCVSDAHAGLKAAIAQVLGCWWQRCTVDQALLRLARMLLLEQNDEWLVGRRYLSESSMALVVATDHPDRGGGDEGH
jgi:hypothetical protein